MPAVFAFLTEDLCQDEEMMKFVMEHSQRTADESTLDGYEPKGYGR